MVQFKRDDHTVVNEPYKSTAGMRDLNGHHLHHHHQTPHHNGQHPAVHQVHSLIGNNNNSGTGNGHHHHQRYQRRLSLESARTLSDSSTDTEGNIAFNTLD